MSEIITRIAPSPTGNLHLGTVRTALYNVLLAKKSSGKFLFRLEDTDQKRSKEEFTQEIIEGFKWLGINWDKPGEMLGLDENGMIRQSQRQEIHNSYVKKLLDEKKAYKCFASPEEIDQLKAEQRKRKEPESYDNRGRLLTEEQVKAYEEEGRKYVIRLNMGDGEQIQWQDVVRGSMSINSKDLGGDPVIQKFNGQVLYNFAVVVDDHEMGMTHVFRGEDHLTNTAKQIAIYKALNLSLPCFGHLPLIFTKDKQKLSKRKHGDIAGVEKYQKEGYLPQALVNYLIATSYTASEDPENEVYTLDEVTKDFNEAGISKSPAIYDIQKLNWFNREYIAKLSYQDLMNHLKDYISYDLNKFSDDEQRLLIEAIRGNLNKFDEIDSNINYFFEKQEIASKLKKFLEEGKPLLQDLAQAIEKDELDFNSAEALKKYIDDLGLKHDLKAKSLFWPIRIAISFRSNGPDLGLIMMLLGKDETLLRLHEAF